MFEPSLLEHDIETGVSTSRIQKPALEHVWIREIAPLDRRLEHGDALVNLPVYAIRPGEVVPHFTVIEVGIFPLAGGLAPHRLNPPPERGKHFDGGKYLDEYPRNNR